MRKQFLRSIIISGVATGLIACGSATTPATTTDTQAVAATTVAPTTQPALDLSALLPDSSSSTALPSLVSGTGEVKTLNDANLNFQVTGTVAQVLVSEGDAVKAGDLLAILDTTLYDQQIAQANASLAGAQASLAALQPNGADTKAAQAQLKQAQAQLDAVKPNSTSADVKAAKLNLEIAEYNLESTTDRLSLAKTQAKLNMDAANQSLQQAEAQFQADKYNWEYVLAEDEDPFAMGRIIPISNPLKKRYETAYQISLSRRDAAQISFNNAKISFEQAQQAETVGVATAEQQVEQAKLSLERLTSPTGKDRASLDAALAQAEAAVARITSQRAQAEAAVAQAEAAVTLAKLNRARAEIRAPFAGVISMVTIDVGDNAAPAGPPAVQLIDTTNLRVEVQISDADIAKVAVDQRVTVSVDAVANQQFEGTVSFVSPIATVIGNVRSYTVFVNLNDTTNLRAGMSARVNLLGN
jgi:HlyD family secretion protein